MQPENILTQVPIWCNLLEWLTPNTLSKLVQTHSKIYQASKDEGLMKKFKEKFCVYYECYTNILYDKQEYEKNKKIKLDNMIYYYSLWNDNIISETDVRLKPNNDYYIKISALQWATRDSQFHLIEKLIKELNNNDICLGVFKYLYLYEYPNEKLEKLLKIYLKYVKNINWDYFFKKALRLDNVSFLQLTKDYYDQNTAIDILCMHLDNNCKKDTVIQILQMFIDKGVTRCNGCNKSLQEHLEYVKEQ